MLTPNVTLLKFMVCVLDFQIFVFIFTHILLFQLDSVKGKFCSVNRKFCCVKAKCGTPKINGLRLRFSNSNLSLHTFSFTLYPTLRQDMEFQPKELLNFIRPSTNEAYFTCPVLKQRTAFCNEGSK